VLLVQSPEGEGGAERERKGVRDEGRERFSQEPAARDGERGRGGRQEGRRGGQKGRREGGGKKSRLTGCGFFFFFPYTGRLGFPPPSAPPSPTPSAIIPAAFICSRAILALRNEVGWREGGKEGGKEGRRGSGKKRKRRE